ncbi:MAG: hemagglutinin repeat-containing protein [Sporomusaceae bacterium]|nr:hemagglutinin repeat-containing protein [Sporomusaceae bacterium]
MQPSHRNNIRRRKLIAWLTLILFNLQPLLAAAQAVADPAAPPAQRPQIETAANGVPVVQIAAPSAAGVSRNQYQQLHVDKNGLIFNNAAKTTATQLAGYIAGNPRLSGGSARLILNEVTGAQPSQLRGYLEIAGPQAGLIIANPNGIAGDGFGFINVGRAVLTTGSPIFDPSGNLDGYRVSGGQISISGDGLDAAGADRVDLISRAVAVNAGIWANELNLVTGANTVSDTTLAARTLTGTGQQPAVALDVSALGGMYAGKIKLIGTEQGVGVNSRGTLAAGSGAISISQTGQIRLGGTLSAAGDISVDTADSLTASGTLYAGGNSRLTAANQIQASGTLAAAGDLSLQAATIQSGGSLAAGVDTAGQLAGSGSLQLSGGRIRASGSNLAARALHISGDQLDLSGAQTYAGQTLTLQAAALNHQNAKLGSGGDLHITAGQLDNRGGQIAAAASLAVSGGHLDNQHGRIEAGALSITAASLANQAGQLLALGDSDAAITLSGSLANAGGRIGGAAALQITAAQLDNQDGQLLAAQDLSLTSQGQLTNQGQIAAGNHLSLEAASLANSGQFSAGGDLTVSLAQTAHNSQTGQLQAGRNLSLTAAHINSSGSLAAGVDADGRLTNPGRLSLSSSGDLTLHGQQLAGGDLALRGASLDLSRSRNQAGGALTLHSDNDLDHRQAVSHGQQLTASAGGRLDNQDAELAAASGDLSLTAASLDNRGGRILHAGAGQLSLATRHDLDNTAGAIRGNGAITLTAASLSNRQGELAAQRQLTLAASHLDNSQGQLVGKQAVQIQAATDNTAGLIEAGQQLALTGSSLDNSGGRIASLDASGLTLTLADHLTNTSGRIGGNGRITITAARVTNSQGQISGSQAVDLTTASGLDNRQGAVLASGRLTLTQTAGRIDNSAGLLQAGSDLTIAAAGADLTGGSLLAAKDLRLSGNTVSLETTQAGGDATITAAASLDNHGGLQAGGQLQLRAASLTNAAALKSGGAVRLDALTVSNDGLVYSQDSVAITTANRLDNRGDIAAAGDVRLSGAAIDSRGQLVAGLTAAGTVGADGSLTVTASDALTASGRNVAGGELTLQGASVTLAGATSQGQSVLVSATGGDIDNRGGSLSASDSLTLTAVGALRNDKLQDKDAVIKAGQLAISAAGISNQGGLIAQVGDANLAITTGDIDNRGGRIAANSRNLSLEATTIDNRQGSIQHAGSGQLTVAAAQTLDNSGGEILGNGEVAVTAAAISNRQGLLAAQRQLALQASSLDNSQGQLIGKQAVKIQAATVNSEGLIEAGQGLDLRGQSLDNSGGRLVSLDGSGLIVTVNEQLTNSGGLIGGNGSVSVTAASLDNSGGQISGKQAVALTTASDLDNRQGSVLADGELTVRQASGLLDNTAGLLQAGSDLTIDASGATLNGGSLLAGEDLTLTGKTVSLETVQAGGNATISATENLTNRGSVQANGELALQAGGVLTNSGSIIGLEAVQVSGDRIDNAAAAAIKSGGKLAIDGVTVVHDGTLYSKAALTVSAADSLAASGSIAAAGDVTLQGKTVATSGLLLAGLTDAGTVGGTGKLTVTAAEELTASGQNLAGGELVLQGASVNLAGATSQGQSVLVTATSGDIDNSGGSISAQGDMTLTAASSLVNDGDQTEAVIKANRLQIKAKNISNAGGLIAQVGDADLTIASGSIDNRGGRIAANSRNLILEADTIDNRQGSLQHAGSGKLTVAAAQTLDNSDGEILGNGEVAVTAAAISNRQGLLAAQRQLTLQASSLDNSQGQLIGKQTVQIQAATVNSEGLIEAGQGLELRGQSLDNSGGRLVSLDGSGLIITVDNELSNSGGLIGGNGSVSVTAASLDNSQGQISGKQAVALTTASGLDNRQGAVLAGGELTVRQTGGMLDNTAGLLQAGSDLTIDASGATINGGSLLAGEALTLIGKRVSLDTVQAGGDATITAAENLTNRGSFQANGELALQAGGVLANHGSLIGLEAVQIRGDRVDNAVAAAIKSGGKLAIDGVVIDNQGTLYSKAALSVSATDSVESSGSIAGSGDVALSGKTVSVSGLLVAGLTDAGTVGGTGKLTVTAAEELTASGRNLAGGELVLQGARVNLAGATSQGQSVIVTATSGDIDNSGGSLSSQADMTLTATGSLVNDGDQTEAVIKANTLQIKAKSISNAGGLIAQVGDADLTIASGSINNRGGRIAANSQNLSLNAKTIDNRQGSIQHAGSGRLSLAGDRLDNSAGSIVGNGAAQLNTATLVNSQGHVSAQQELTIDGDSLDNQDGTLVGGGRVALDLSGGLHNQDGAIEAGKQLQITAAKLTNQAGSLTSLDASGLILDVQQSIDNRAGLIGANGTVAIDTKQLDNSGGQLLSGSDLSLDVSDVVDNSDGKLAAGQDLTLTTATLDNTGGKLEAGRDLELRAAQIHNHQGKLAANRNLGMAFASLSGNGSVNAGRDLGLTVAGDFNNAAGSSWQAANDFNLTVSGVIDNSGTIEAGNSLRLQARQIDNHAGATLAANKALLVTATETVTNRGSLFGQDIVVKADSLKNDGKTAAIAATNSIGLYAADTFDNSDEALVYSQGDIVIAGSATQDAAGEPVRAKQLINQSARIEAEQDIAIYADEVVNKKSVLEVEYIIDIDNLYPLKKGEYISYLSHFQDGPDLDKVLMDYYINVMGIKEVSPIRGIGTLLLRGQSKVKSQVLKDSPAGKIVAGRSLTFQAMNTLNDNSWMLAGKILSGSGNVDNQVVSGSSHIINHYAIVSGYAVPKDEFDVNVYISVEDLYEEEVESIQDDLTTTLFGGGKSINIEGTNINNVSIPAGSMVSGSEAINTLGKNSFANTTLNEGSATNSTGLKTSIIGSASANIEPGPLNSSGVATDTTAVTADAVSVGKPAVDTAVSGQPMPETAVSQLSSNGAAAASTIAATDSGPVASLIDSGLVAAPPASPAALAATATDAVELGISPAAIDPAAIPALLPGSSTPVTPPQTNNGGVISLPQNGLYMVKPEPSAHYLVETNPRFTSYKNFFSSDYLLAKLNYDPAATQKRLGDGFYEQKLVREQITDLTGRVFLNGYDSAEAQYQALLQNAATEAASLQLAIGIALSPEQQAALSSDIVWLVEQEVDGHTVLVPVVYLAALEERELAPTGAVISADSVNIQVSGNVANTGTIKALDTVKIGAANVANIGGSIAGGQLTQIAAAGDILNLSGSIGGQDIALSAGNNITSQTYAGSLKSTYHTKTLLGNTATITAGNTLTAMAGKKINLQGTELQAGTDIILGAENLQSGVVGVTNTEHWNVISQDITNLGTSITAGGNIHLQASQDLSLQAASLQAGNDLTLAAGNTLDLTAVANSSQSDRAGNGYNFAHILTIDQQLTSLEAGNNLTLLSGSDMTLAGVQAAAGDAVTVASGGDLRLDAVKDRSFSDAKSGDSRNYQRRMTDDETAIGTTFTADGAISIAAAGDLTLTAATIGSDNGHVGLSAGGDINLAAVSEKHESLSESKRTKKRTFSKKVTTTRDYSLVNAVVGSSISGDSVAISAGQDLAINAGSLVATNDLTLAAGNDLTLGSVAETGAEEHYKHVKKSGLFSGGGLGFTLGSQSVTSTTKEKVLAEIGSSIGSLDGSLSLIAGNDLKSAGSSLLAGKDIAILGKTVTLDNTIDTYDLYSQYQIKQSGLSVSLGGTAIDLGLDAVNNLERAGQVSDQRLKALYAYKAGKVLDELSEPGKLDSKVSVNISIGSSKSSSQQTVHSETVNPSNLTAGGTVTIKATQGNADLTAVQVAAQDIRIEAVGDINLGAAQNQYASKTDTKSSAWALGGSIGQGFFGSISKGSGQENETSTTNQGSSLEAQNNLTLISGEDLNIIGSKAIGETVVAKIGQDLNLISLQDTSAYQAKSKNSGIGFSSGQKETSAKKESTGGVNGAESKGQTDSSYASVTGQAGIHAGAGGFDIEVGKNTDLQGAVISSEAEAEKNRLSTDTLTYSDIANKAEYSASSTGTALDTSKIADAKDSGLTPAIGTKATGDADSTTKSAIAEGTIEVRSGNADLANLSRDTANSLNALSQIFDKKTVAEQQELAKVFGEEAFKAIGDLDLKEGSPEKAAVDAVVGGIMAKLGGGDALSGAAGGGLNQLVMNELAKIGDSAAMQWASLVIGAAAAKIVGGDAQTGASVAASETKNNYLTHEQYREMVKELARIDKSDLSEEEKESSKAEVKAYYKDLDKKQDQIWQENNKDDITGWFDVNGNLVLDGFRFEKVGVDLDGEEVYLCSGIRSLTINGRKGYNYEEAKEYVIGFSKGIKNKVDEIPKFLLNSSPEQIDEMIVSIPAQLQAAWEEGLADTAINVGNKVYKITLGSWKTQYDEIQAIIDPEERGIKTAELLVDIGSTIDAARAVGKTVTSFSKFGSTVTKESSKTVNYGDQYAKVGNRKVLKPDVEYVDSNGYKFTTDGNGRISSAEAKLELGKADRNPYAQRTVGGEDRLLTDDGGHLIASIFKGSGEIDNLVPMNSTLNRSEYKSLENTWKKALEEGKIVNVKIEPIYQGNSLRPAKFKVDYTIDGKAYSERLTN